VPEFRPHLLWKARQSDVDRDAGRSAQQENAIGRGERRRISDPRLECVEKRSDEGPFRSESGEQRDVDVAREARLSPADHRQTTNDA
jgi:hypothetical protein